jgi:hypothetical protein
MRYTYEESDIEQLDAIFSHVFRKSALTDPLLEKERLNNVARLATIFAENVFQDEYAVLYELAVTRRLTTGEWGIIAPVIEENREIIMGSHQVSLEQYKSEFSNEDSFDAFMEILQALYNRLCEMEFKGAEGFRTAVAAFVGVFEKKYTRRIIAVMNTILGSSEPFLDLRSGRRREYRGYSGANAFFAVERLKVDALRGAQRSRQFVVDDEWLNEKIDPIIAAEKALRTERLFDLGLPQIDDIWSGARRTRMICIMGPPKGGKTTLAGYFVHRALKAERRVAVWVMEGSAEKWIDKLVAARCKIDHSFDISTKDFEDGFIGFTKEQRNIVDAARVAITKDSRLSFIEETGYVEDFIEVIDGHYRALNNFDVLVVDPLVNLQSLTGRRKAEYLSSAFMLLKDYVEHKFTEGIPPLCVVTAQFKQEAIKDARNSADVFFDETAGGETSETIRTPDEVIGIFGTPQQEQAGKTSLHHIASRHTKKFPTFQVVANFGAGLFFPEP